MPQCRTCGTPVSEQAPICPECGTHLQGDPARMPEASAPPIVLRSAPLSMIMPFLLDRPVSPTPPADGPTKLLSTTLSLVLKPARWIPAPPLPLAVPLTAKTLPPNLVRDWVLPDGRARVQALPKGDPNDTNVLREFATAVLRAEPAADRASD